MRAEPDWMQPPGPIRVGISACLLGEAVRYDGGHKRDAYIVDTLGRCFAFVPVCPEVAVGLGVPRPPLRLLAAGETPPRAVGVHDPALDPTDALRAYGRRMADELGGLSGYLLKRGSPSCGMAGVKVYRPGGGVPTRRGVGLFAAELMAALPNLPLEEEGRLADPALCENFIARVLAYRRWQALLEAGLTPARLAEFHRRHRLTLMAHGAAPARRLEMRVAERQAAEAGRLPPTEPEAAYLHDYLRDFMALLRRKTTRRAHTQVLQHLQGTLQQALDAPDQAELLAVIQAYRTGAVPLRVPVTLLRQHFRRHPHPDLTGQTYLEPHPAERLLRGGC